MAAGMAHEIRNPLGGIGLYAGLLAKQLADRPKSKTLAEKIAVGVSRLDTIVNDILAFAGEIKPQFRAASLAGVLNEARDLAAGRIERAGARLELRFEADATIEMDPGLMVRALGNLLFNACDAAGEGEVRLAGWTGEDQAWIEVSDSGPGVSSETMERMFNPFYTTKEHGTGLGLAIVHRIIDSHGGAIAVDNATGVGELGGARFVLRLPTKQNDAAYAREN
jgi:signal transduction histidine kinase